MPERQPYQGSARKLVLAFDVGTTYSGVSYSILTPGEPTVISSVTRFPASDHVGGNSKVPSIVYYDRDGVPRAFGSEALQESIIERAEEEEWIKAEWWKLRLGPKSMAGFVSICDQDLPPLPPKKTAIQVLSDFMMYLFQCAKIYIQETHASGREIWESLEDNIDFVFSHPNGWESPQQMQIRRAAVIAKLVPDSPDGQARIQLITESEASVYFFLGNERTAGLFREDQGVMVIEAGDTTVDVNSYYMTISPPSLHEIAPVASCLQGAVFVTRRAHEFLTVKLRGSKFGTPEDIAQMTSIFDKTTKLRFTSPAKPSYIRFGTVRDRDPAYDIKSGQLKLAGTEVADFFEPSVAAIAAIVKTQRKLATRPVNSIFLVGSFAASDWLFSRLQEYVKPLNLNFCRPDSHINKVVADGALAFYLEHKLSARVAKYTYGTRCAVKFNKHDEQHKLRTVSAVPRTTVSEIKEFRKDFVIESEESTSCDTIATEVVCYRGNVSNPRWMDSEAGMFSKLCTIHADTSQVSKEIGPRRGSAGLQFYRKRFCIVLMFGTTDLQAQISWMEDGEEKRGPATVVFEQNLEEL